MRRRIATTALLIALASSAFVAGACEQSALVRVTNELTEPITVTIDGQAAAIEPGAKDRILSGRLNTDIDRIEVRTASGESFTLNDSGYGGVRISVSGPPLAVVVD